MKHISVIRHYLLGAVALFTVLATGCVKEDLEECYTLTLKVENAKGEDITGAGDVAASLFIFDENYNFLEQRKLDNEFVASRQNIVLTNYPQSRKLHIVAWGNEGTVDSDNQIIENGQVIEDLKLMLKSKESLAQSPDALYYGSKLVATKADGNLTQKEEVVVRLKTGKIEMLTQGLDNALRAHNLRSTAAASCDFYMNRTLSGYDYTGKQIGDSVYYNPQGQWVANEWATSGWNEVCAGQNLSCSLVSNGVSLGETMLDDNGQPISVNPGDEKRIIFIFDAEGRLSVKVEVIEWGQVGQNPDIE